MRSAFRRLLQERGAAPPSLRAVAYRADAVWQPNTEQRRNMHGYQPLAAVHEGPREYDGTLIAATTYVKPAE